MDVKNHYYLINATVELPLLNVLIGFTQGL